MSLMAPAAPDEGIVYPDSDGKPMAENSDQFDWITISRKPSPRVG